MASLNIIKYQHFFPERVYVPRKSIHRHWAPGRTGVFLLLQHLASRRFKSGYCSASAAGMDPKRTILYSRHQRQNQYYHWYFCGSIHGTLTMRSMSVYNNQLREFPDSGINSSWRHGKRFKCKYLLFSCTSSRLKKYNNENTR